MLKSGITEIGPCPEAFTTAWGENGQSVFPQLIQSKQMALQAAVAFAVQKKTADTPPSDLSQGCAHSKPRVSTRFTPKVMHT